MNSFVFDVIDRGFDSMRGWITMSAVSAIGVGALVLFFIWLFQFQI